MCLLAPLSLWLGAAPAVASSSARGVTKITLGHVSATEEGSRPSGAYVAVDPGSDTIAVTGSVGGTNETAIPRGRVWLVNGRRHRLAHTVDLPGASVSSIVDDPSTETFYVADPSVTVPPDTSAGAVAVISARTGKLTDEIAAPGIAGGIGIDSKTDLVYAGGPGYAITAINAHSNAVIGPIGSGNIFYPGPLAVDPKTDVAFIGGGASGGTVGVWFANLATGYLYGVPTARPVNVATADPPIGVATDPGLGRTYVALDDSSGSAVGTIDGTSERFAATKRLNNGNSILGIAVNAKTHAVYVTNVNETAGCPGFVDELSGRTGKVVATVHNITNPEAVAVDPNSDTVYVQNGGVLDAFHGGLANKQKKCGAAGVVVGAER